MLLNCIHDFRRMDRMELLRKESNEHGLIIKLWDAVKEFPRAKQNINKAHKNIVRYAKEKHMREILICEDDFHLTAPKAFEYFLENKPKDFDLYLAGIIWGNINPDNTTSDYAGNQFYIIHERFYNTFLEADPNRDIDRAVMRKGKYVVCNPFAVIQHESYSDNQKKTHKNSKLYKDRKLYGQT